MNAWPAIAPCSAADGMIDRITGRLAEGSFLTASTDIGPGFRWIGDGASLLWQLFAGARDEARIFTQMQADARKTRRSNRAERTVGVVIGCTVAVLNPPDILWIFHCCPVRCGRIS
jgi:hypothetical protein